MRKERVLSHDAEDAFEELYDLVSGEGRLILSIPEKDSRLWIYKDIIVGLEGGLRSVKTLLLHARESRNGRILFDKGNRSVLSELHRSEKNLFYKKMLKIEQRQKEEDEKMAKRKLSRA